jgi:outer membrane biogenesis lipoprotein LolB
MTGKKTSWLFAGLFFSFLYVGCRIPSPALAPALSELRSFEGYASLKITRFQETSKTRFSFLVELPSLGRIEVLDPLSRVVFDIFIKEDKAYFVLPSEKMYWQGTKEEVLEKFLGFRLNLQEMASILSGRWPEAEAGQRPYSVWDLRQDTKNRIVSGRREGLQVDVRDFFVRSPAPRLLNFRSLESDGNLKVLSIRFNGPNKKDVFLLSFLDTYIPKTWEEIEKRLRNED